MYDQGAKSEGRAGGQNSVPVTERCGEVTRQLETAAKLSEALHDSIQKLGARIGDVVRSEPTCEKEEAKNPCCSVSMAEAMRSGNRRIEAAIDKINSLIERCEL